MFVGSGNVVTRDTEVGDFNEVTFNGSAQVYLVQGDTTGVTMQGEDNVLDTYTITTENDSLFIGSARMGLFDVIPTKDVVITIYLTDIDTLSLNGAAKIQSDRLQTDDLVIEIDGATDLTLDMFADSVTTELNGAGSIELLGNVEQMTTDINGAASFNAKDMRSRECTVTINGAGSAQVNCSNKLTATINGTGSIEYLGDPTLEQEVNGVGSIKQVND